MRQGLGPRKAFLIQCRRRTHSGSGNGNGSRNNRTGDRGKHMVIRVRAVGGIVCRRRRSSSS
eukprot:4268769-Pyramimonas_sp.AAC.1